MTTADMQPVYDGLRRDATRLAGGLTELSQRATVYHHIFRESSGNHAFPLIAAHGALWARGWFQFGFTLGRLLAWPSAFDRELRQRRLALLDDFANAFRDINRRVCIDVYTNFYFTRQYGEQAEAAQFIPAPLLDALRRVHAARRCGRALTDAERRDVFLAHFLQEQEFIVGPAIASAMAKFDWPLVRAIAVRPVIRFAYFPRSIWFRNFASRDERIQKGLLAFDTAAKLGWQNVEASLRKYDVLPERFFATSDQHFATLRNSILSGQSSLPPACFA